MFIINNYINPGPEAELANQVDHWSIPVPDDIKETVLGKRKGWETIQVGTDTMNIPFQNEPADVFFRASNVFADPDADPEVVQLFTSIMLENQDAIHEIHPGLRMFGFGPAGENVPYDELWGFTGTDENTLFHEGAINHFEAEDIDYPSA